jgi:3-oxoacyl-[acyl-carrier protein] reductase
MSVDMMATVRAGHAAIPFLELGPAPASSTSSLAARCAAARPPYAAMKAAVNHYTASLARILAPKRIRVNAIAPGSIEFPGGRWERARLNNLPIYHAIRASIPLAAWASPRRSPTSRFSSPRPMHAGSRVRFSPWMAARTS